MGIINNTKSLVQMQMYIAANHDAMSFPARVAAKMNNKNVTVAVADDKSKKINDCGVYPMLVTPEGSICESVAVAKYLAHGHAQLMGGNAEERARVDQWIMWSVTGHLNEGKKAMAAMYGTAEVTAAEYTVSMNAVKNNAKVLNVALKGKNWLVADHVTLADITVCCHFIGAQQTILDAGFRKAMPDYSAWFERVCALPEFIAVCGNVKSAAKPVKPTTKVEEKKVVAKKEAPKPKDGDDVDPLAPAKKAKSALEMLPETKFDLFNFKTFMVNEPDRKGKGIDQL